LYAKKKNFVPEYCCCLKKAVGRGIG